MSVKNTHYQNATEVQENAALAKRLQLDVSQPQLVMLLVQSFHQMKLTDATGMVPHHNV